MEAIRQRIQTQIPDNLKQIPDTLKPKPATHLESGVDSIPATLAPTIVSPILATPTQGDTGAAFTVAYATPIAAPPLTVLAAFISPATYAAWNPVFPKVTVTRPAPQPVPPLLAESSVAKFKPGELLLEGSHVVFEVHLTLDPAKTTSNTACIITVLEDFTKATAVSGGEGHRGRKGYRVAWKTTGWTPPPFLLKAERVHEFLESEDGTGTEYRCYETFFGPLAPVVRYTMLGQLEAAFTAWMEGLKCFVETGGSISGIADADGNSAAAPASAAAAAATAAS
ncbi:hypothetical protein C8035_v005476 [Colletotrichum spinosum]|uniref:Uncharacterized protein n=1 Tax=Colletotrichum spinosum TaxID=1347390 RepID=A0A4R8Q201_9PEZI|nr:hypothetical protein C8035_v005476 [Colletotrichum spinosum]